MNKEAKEIIKDAIIVVAQLKGGMFIRRNDGQEWKIVDDLIVLAESQQAKIEADADMVEVGKAITWWSKFTDNFVVEEFHTEPLIVRFDEIISKYNNRLTPTDADMFKPCKCFLKGRQVEGYFIAVGTDFQKHGFNVLLKDMSGSWGVYYCDDARLIEGE